MKKLFLISFLLISILVHSQITWTEEFPGIWKGIFGNPDQYNLVNASGAKPQQNALSKFSPIGFPFQREEINAEIVNGKTYLRIPLQREEQIYGFGLNFQTVHQRGKILNLHVDHYGGKDNGRTHAPVPFYVSSSGYGVFINSAQYITVYAGTGVRKNSKTPPAVKDRNTDRTWSSRPYSDAVEILIPAQGIEFYVFAGESALDAVKKYNLFFGGGTLPPKWGLGFTQRVRTLYTAEDVEREADEFKEKGFPLDFIGLEPGWQTKAYPCTFEWDKKRFPNPEEFIQRMSNKGIRINLWTNPYVSPDASIYKKIEPYTGSHTVWNGVVPDLNTKEARQILSDQFSSQQVKLGVSGYKIDEVDGYDFYLWPDIATFPSKVSAEQTRQTYGVQIQKLTDELYRKENKRTFGLVRASNAGANNLPYVIYNDYYSHQDFITALINSGFAGVLWTPEVRNSKSSEEWLRRFQTVTFSPMAMINAWSSGTKPWSFPEVFDQIKYFADLRMKLIPYFYSEFAKYHFEGTPPFRSLVFEKGFRGDNVVTGSQNLEDNPYLEVAKKEIKDQYMVGEYLLIAPVFAGETSRKVTFPIGNWYDFYTGNYAGNGEEITVTPGLDKIPVYVKDGGIIPMMKESTLQVPTSKEKVDLNILYYGSKDSSYKLYDDDGVTFDYEKGVCSWREIKVTKNKKGQFFGKISAPEKGKPNTIGKVTFEFMTK